jgi:hypothetical protein
MATIQLKRGRIADLIAVNPTPAEGEIIVDLDSGKFKIGDGARPWGELPYSNVLTDIIGVPSHANTHGQFGSDPLQLTAVQISDFNAAANVAVAGKLLRSLPDVNTTASNSGDILVYTANVWANTAPSSFVSSLWVTPPATATASGTAGQIAYDSSYVYICVSNSTWVRAALETW